MHHDIAWLESRVTELLEHVDTLKGHIEAHDFDRARLEAEGLALYCAGTNKIANRIADKEDDDAPHHG